jgi:hypothetical protein
LAENDAEWDALNRLRISELSPDEDENEDSIYGTAAQNLEEQTLPEDSEDQEANLTFFGEHLMAEHNQTYPVIIIVETARTSLQSPIPERAQV